MEMRKMAVKCPEVRELLSAWLDGELTPEDLALVTRHLDSCAGCRRELAQLEALEEALGALPGPRPSGLPEKVRARLSPRRRHTWQSLALVASLVVGVFLGGALAQNFYPQSQPEAGLSTEVASMDAFHDFPQGSMGMILASYQEDEGSRNCK
jgi:predicted anti-sigma-YlaC factor YlaD